MYLVVGVLILIAAGIVSIILLSIKNDWALKKFFKITGELNLEQGLFDLKPGADAQIYVDAQYIKGEVHGKYVREGSGNSITLVRDKRAISEITFILENRQQMAIVHDYFQEMNKSGYDIRFEPFVPIIPRFL
ncbi:hypothetical protein AB9P05_02120 [Roseivirga sp. BDSF3-8]|uniref:hypothetical protein n=1 Tax=Roseivirga sp. BDSF3-8 TaxID=3241598 RepID=UPI003531A63F